MPTQHSLWSVDNVPGVFHLFFRPLELLLFAWGLLQSLKAQCGGYPVQLELLLASIHSLFLADCIGYDYPRRRVQLLLTDVEVELFSFSLIGMKPRGLEQIESSGFSEIRTFQYGKTYVPQSLREKESLKLSEEVPFGTASKFQLVTLECRLL